MDMNTANEIEILVRARTPLVYIYSSEERRVLETLKRIAVKLTAETTDPREHVDVQLLMWSVVSGLVKWDDDTPIGTSTNSAVAVLQHIAAIKGSAIIVLRDYHPYLQEPAIVRRLRELAVSFAEGDKHQLRTLVILSPRLVIPPELEKEIALVDFPLPSKPDLEAVIDHVQTEARSEEGGFPVSLDDNSRSEIAQALLGLTIAEAENTLAKSIVVTGELGHKAIPLILKEKEQIVRKSGGGAVEYITPRCTVDDVGGLDLLKAWAMERSESWGPRAMQFKLVPPRGVLLIGEPGVGKSLSVKAIVSLWQVPLLRLDIGALFTSALGGTEEKMRGVLKLADSLGRCVLWLDEVEKGLSGLGSSNLSDGGAQARIFATLLTWMEEHESPVFVAATANLTTLDVLPPEFIQRFSEMFWLDKPNDAERAQILTIHLKDRGLNPDEFGIARLVTETQGMVGRQIRNLVQAAMHRPFREQRGVTTDDVLEALKSQRQGVREFAGVQARPASSSNLPVPQAARKRTVRMSNISNN
jgi:SpoVK/Ycf46/Vps4 family AAA+-type ATPase